MSQQLIFPGFQGAPRGPKTRKLMFMIRLEPGVADEAWEICSLVASLLGADVDRIERHRMHITLELIWQKPQPVPDYVVEKAIGAAKALSAARFEVTFDQVKSYSNKPGHHPLVPCGGGGLEVLRTFQWNLGDALLAEGITPVPQFDPHITLAYAERLVSQRPVPPLTWSVTEFTLVERLARLTVYNTLGRWSL